jgi:hypothetical protein
MLAEVLHVAGVPGGGHLAPESAGESGTVLELAYGDRLLVRNSLACDGRLRRSYVLSVGE